MKARVKKLKDMKRENCTHIGIWTISAAVLLGAIFAASTTVAQTVPDEGYPIMRPDPGTLKRWFDSYSAAPAIGMTDSEMVAPAALGQHSVLPHVPYVPVDRSQGDCGNCWIWAGTGCMEVAHHVKNGVFDRLSIQYLHSNYNGGAGPGYACCGGSLSDVQGFYAGTGIAIPWSNPNANWQDWITDCPSGSTTVPGASIVMVPRYGIHHINRNSIVTQTVNQATAIANIKSVLNNDDGIYFGFCLPNSTAWTAFFNFWNFQPETAVWDDWYSGTPYDPSDGEGGCHAVLCVGYDDTDPGNSYWIMLNSWGTAWGNRPNGLFRVDMDMDYGSSLPGIGFSLRWQMLDVEFNNNQPEASANGPYAADEGSTIFFDAGGSSDPDGDVMMYRWDFDNDGVWDTGWSSNPVASHTYDDDHIGAVRVELSEVHMTDEVELTDDDTAPVIVYNVPPVVDAGPDQSVNEGDIVSFSGIFADPGINDTHIIEWDFGDGSPPEVGSLTPTHAYGDNGSYTVTLTVTDDDGGVGTDTLTVLVSNVAPTTTIDPMSQPNPQFILPGVHTLTFVGSFTDPGWLDTHEALWNFGDGTVLPGTLVEENVPPDATGTATGTHVYWAPGMYTVSLEITDDDGAVGSHTMDVVVVDEYGALEEINNYIQGLPDSAFKSKPDKQKNTINNMIVSIWEKLDGMEYQGAIKDLQSNLRGKADGSVDGKANNDWIVDPTAQTHICMKIDDLTAYLDVLLALL